MSVRTIAALYRTLREYRDVNGFGRIGAFRAAVVLDWLSWRRSREARRSS